jgi:D-xylonolactonase
MDYSIVQRPSRDRLGEGPTWVGSRNELIWVDIEGHAVHRLRLSDDRVVTLAVGEVVGWVLPRAGTPGFIAGLKSGFALFDLDSGARELLGSPEPDRPDNRLNDAKVDSAGRIWTGTKDDSGRTHSGCLYRLDADHRWHAMDHGYGVTNGPTFSLDGSTLYHTDSAARTVFAFDLAEDGSISGKREWLRFEDAWGHPDGMCTDAEGCLWIAHWGGGRLSRFSPGGKYMRSIELPASNITSCAFAGADLSRLFVTSSWIDHEDEPHAGALFEVDAGVGGLPPVVFAG